VIQQLCARQRVAWRQERIGLQGILPCQQKGLALIPQVIRKAEKVRMSV
jgi:hypothetical protein